MRPISVSTPDASGGATYSDLVRLDEWCAGPVIIQCVVTGTANYTVQSSQDDPNSPTNPVALGSMAWDSTLTGVVGAIGSSQAALIVAPTFIRLVQNSGNGSVRMTVTQGGVTPL